MSDVPKDLKYSKEHEWVRINDDVAIFGITDHAQEQLGDIVYIELPSVGSQVTQFEPAGNIESVKAASDLYSPVSGEVVEVNEQLKDRPELINQSPYGEGWMVKVKVDGKGQLDNLLSPADYEALLSSQN